MAIYFTSDLHFCHNRDFIWHPRGCTSVYDMNIKIISNWHDMVDYDDDVYILGDIMLNNNDEGIRLLKALNGKLHIIRGNHDTDTRMELYKKCYNVVSVSEGEFFNYNGYHFYLSHYPCLCSNNDEDKSLKKRMINLCGHIHTPNKFLDMNKGLIYHVELDAHNLKPVSIDTIIQDIESYTK